MSKKTQKKKDTNMERHGLKSMQLSVSLITIGAVLVSIILCMVVAVPKFTSQVQAQVKNNMYNMAVSYGKLANNALSISGKLTADKATALLKDVKIEGVDSSYAYLVTPTGTMLYHPTAEKIGKPVENEVVSGIVDKIANGEIPDPAIVEYEFKGTMKYASYYVTEVGNCILVITADESDVLSPITSFVTSIVITSLIILIVLAAAAYFISGTMTKPLIMLTEIVNKTADFNFESNPHAHHIMERRDEAGMIGRSIQKMRTNLRAMVESIDGASTKISTNAVSLKEVTNAVNENSSDNSATSEELAAGMQETSASTENINMSIGTVVTNTKEINELTVEGEQISREIQEKAEKLEKSVVEARRITDDMYAEVKEKSDKAIEQSKAVNKINDLAGAIMDIASQTSLLSLNASIEAARAGESGRGFAVVAEQIGTLANQSAQTVAGITEIVNEVHKSVDNMSECLKKTQDFLENKVVKDYEQFTEVSQQYNNDAHVFQASMQDIHASIDSLNATIDDISDAISAINSTIGESAIGVTDIAAKTTDIVSLTSKTYDMVEESVTYADELKGIVAKFRLE